MTGRIVDGPFQTIQPNAIVEFLSRLRSWVMPQVLPGVHLGSEHGAELASPVSTFQVKQRKLGEGDAY
jgi:hypothetical protein